MTRILIVDDHAMIRRGLATILTHELPSGVARCDEASNGTEALQMIIETPYDIAILDISMPEMDGLELLNRLKQKRPDLPVLVVSMHPVEQYALRALRCGAAGFLSKHQAADELIAATTQVLNGKRYVSPVLSEQILNQAISGELAKTAPTHKTLSNREFQILKLLSIGQIPKCIAGDLGISVKTISTFKRRIFKKMNFRNDSDMISYTINNKLIEKLP
jgi:two-component system, NarL family, invasion response regulator UvrY